MVCHSVLNFVVESGAKGCGVIVSGKLCVQHAKSIKFKGEYLISFGQPVKDYIDSAVRYILPKRGVLSIKFKVTTQLCSEGQAGPHNAIV
ncbi:hypothetical protein PVL29_023867 [Vitis rotundifolia]|uniref:Small ribosomal subunit protein uS3 C-terminal domain-containing protein n=1 Tax=Vitis rotundifolia TaxID=103349 RepID=A0AA38YQ89_VITRO|nr:hypothetical protein PVL29_023867 [Vitis rotundifolia]